MWPLTVLMRQTRQVVFAINQSILLGSLWMTTSIFTIVTLSITTLSKNNTQLDRMNANIYCRVFILFLCCFIVSFVMLNVVMLSTILLNVDMLSVSMLNVRMLNVVAPSIFYPTPHCPFSGARKCLHLCCKYPLASMQHRILFTSN
jgi:phosphoglycerol transferase MdoB-like AlkP superfamily enzyme